MILIQMILIALLAVVIFTFIGYIPGTDETSVLMPITLALVLTNIAPILILTFFIAAIVTLNLTNMMPAALVSLPGGVLSSPTIEHTLKVKQEHQSPRLIRKIAAAAFLGVIITIPLSFLISQLILPFANTIKPYAAYLFLFGAIFLALNSKNKGLSLVSIIPLGLLFQAFRALYWHFEIVSLETNITTSFFLAITVGPLVHSLINLFDPIQRQALTRTGCKYFKVPKDDHKTSLNPFKILSKEELKNASLATIISNFLFVLSPVGLIILLGESLGKKTSKQNQPYLTVSIMSALAQSTYLSGIIIPLFALGIPLSPTAIGPGSALFNAPPIYTLENNLHFQLSSAQFVGAVVVGALIALAITYFIISRYASKITSFILKKVPHEAVLGLFVGFVVLLSYMEAGVVNVFGVFIISYISGSLNKLGVNVGVQFMTLYAAPFLLGWLM